MFTLTNHVIAQAGFTLRGAMALWEFSQHQVLRSKREALGTEPCVKSRPGYYITFKGRSDEGLS